MLFILIGIALVVASFQLAKANYPQNRFSNPARIGGAVLMVAGVAASCFVTIPPGEVGVQVLFGDVQSGTLESGLHFINPVIEIQRFNVQTQNYTMSSVHDEGDKNGDDAIQVLTSDGLEVTIDLTVLFRVNSSMAPQILKEIGLDYKNVIVRPVARTKIRDNAVYYDAISLYSTKRDEFQDRTFKDIQKLFISRGLELEQMLVRNITLPTSVKQAIESKINAEQESQKMQFVLTKEKQEADRKRVEAQGIADYQKIISLNLTDKQLQYEMIKAQKEIALSPNTKIIVTNGKDLPMIMNP